MNKRELDIVIPINISIVYDSDRIDGQKYRDVILSAMLDAEQAVRSALTPYLGPLAIPMV